MSFFTEANQDAYSGSAATASYGPRLGFLGAWEASYAAQQKTASMFGLEFAFRQREQEQIDALRAAGITPHRSLNDSEGETFSPFTNAKVYSDAAKEFQDGGDSDTALRIAGADAEILKLRAEHPDLKLKTYSELWDDVRQRAQESERRWDRSETSFGGMVGGFLGGTVAGVDPRTDPFNTLTLGVGGAGKSVVGRIVSEAGAQGLTEAFNQVSGVQENRRLLGLDYGIGNAAEQVGMAVAGGAAIQGVGEIVGAGLKAANRRWFSDKEAPPAPVPEPVAPKTGEVLGAPEQTAFRETPIVERVNVLDDFHAFMDLVGDPKPYGETRLARQRTVLDMENVEKQLDSFSGPAPWEVKPQTDTAAVPYPNRVTYDQPYTRVINNLDTVDDIARRVDPETFRVYDKLDRQQQTVRGWIDELDTGREQRAAAAVKDLDDKIAETQKKLEKASAKNAPRLERQLADLKGARAEQFDAVRGVDTPDQAKLRERLVKLDEEKRNMAPLVSRAYEQAKGQWRSSSLDADAMKFLREREKGTFKFRDDIPEAQPTVERQIGTTVDLRDVFSKPSVTDRVPALQSRPDIVQSMPQNTDAADALAKVVETELKGVADAVEQFRSTLDALQETPDGKLLLPNGQELHLKDDFIADLAANGETKTTSLKKLLTDLQNDELALKAVGTCSTGSPSSTAS